jgi:lysophospholipase L1-like esterase
VVFMLLALGLGLMVAVVAVELALRAYDPLPNPLLDLRDFYRLDGDARIETTPGWVGRQFVEGRYVPIHMNALGLRGAEIGPKAAGERRVLLLGDSFVWGMGVEDGETIPARLEAALREAGTAAVVGNAGMFGTGPREWGYTLQRHRGAFAPDLAVAVLYVGNDVLDTLQAPLGVVDGMLLTSDFARTARDSWRFWLRLRSRLWDKFELAASGAPFWQQVQRETFGPGFPLGDALFLDRDPARDAEVPFVADVLQRVDAAFGAFRQALGDLPVLVVILPARSVAVLDYAAALAGQNDAQWVPKEHWLDPALHQRGRGHRRLQALLTARGLPSVDLSDRILGEPDRQAMYLPTDGHFTAEGCRRVAEWLLPEVVARLR